MTLIDTSAWVEFLRDTGSRACVRVDKLLAGDVATCHSIRMEVFAGARDEQHLLALRRLLARAVILPTRPADFEMAGALYRQCRRRGETVRKLMDCLIAAHALREHLPVLHADADFEVLARHAGLRLDGPQR